MLAKSVSLVCFTNVFVVLQISYGKPTENLTNHNISESVDIIREEGDDVNASFLETVSVSLTVLAARAETTAAAEGVIANSTAEPDYDDYNSTSSTLSELEEDDLDSLSMQFNGSTESSSPLSSLITDEMEEAGSLDESVIAASARTLARQDPSDSSVTTSSAAEDDSIIIASMGSSFNQATVQPPLLRSSSPTEPYPTETFSSSSSSESSSSSSSDMFSSSSQSAIHE